MKFNRNLKKKYLMVKNMKCIKITENVKKLYYFLVFT